MLGTGGNKVCRICYCEEHAEGMGEFLEPTPCNCAGGRSAVHALCLQRWQAAARERGQWALGRVCHACESEYRVNFAQERVPVGIVGGTGLVGRSLAAALASHPIFSLGPVVGSSASVGKTLGEVWRDKEAKLEAHYGPALWSAEPCPASIEMVQVVSVDALATSGCDLVISCIAPALGHIEDALQAAGLAVFSMSPHAREDPRNPLVVAEANGFAVLAGDAPAANLRAAARRRKLPLIKSPNCVVCGCGVVLAALDRAFGLASLSATTFQSLSGRGDAKYSPPDVVVGNVYPLAGTVEKTDELQRAELRRLFPSLDKCAVTSHRVPVRSGHYVHLGLQLKAKPRSLADVERCLENFNPLHGKGLPSAPAKPIVLVQQAGRPRPADDAHGMAVAVGQLKLGDDHDLFDLSLAVVIDNVVRGAYGAVSGFRNASFAAPSTQALLNAELYYFYVRPELCAAAPPPRQPTPEACSTAMKKVPVPF